MISVGKADTRASLVDAAGHLFARRGIEGTALRDVVERSGQRNASAVQYHFGGRWELVTAVLARHHDTVAGWADPGGGSSAQEVVGSLVDLLRPELASEGGRDFLRVVFELVSRYPSRWEAEAAVHGGMERLVVRLVEASAVEPPARARARAVAVTQFVCYQMAERARDLGEGVAVLDEHHFAVELVAMGSAMLTAPVAAAVTTAP
jgi:AcrR family transcriptional regulator